MTEANDLLVTMTGMVLYNSTLMCLQTIGETLKNVDNLTDPYDNSINEKCARIRMAFVSSFSDELAGWYYIDGRKGDRKCIRLPRELVIVANDCRRR